MKRHSTIPSPNSDFEFDISEIKNKYKRSKKEKKPEQSTSSSNKKEITLPKGQLTLQAGFDNAKPIKRHGTCLEDYFKKSNVKSNAKQEISADDFFSSTKKSKNNVDVNSNLFTESPPVKAKTETKEKSDSKFIQFVVETSPLKTKPVVNKTIDQPIESLKTPTKEPKHETDINSPPKSANKKGYYGYLNRSGPVALGSKEIPEGSPTCLSGMTFVMTGVLESIERDDAQALIEKHGGRVTKALSGKTTYLIVGTEPGESKIQKAQKLKTKEINEEELFQMIRNSATKSSSSQPSSKNEPIKSKNEPIKSKNEPITSKNEPIKSKSEPGVEKSIRVKESKIELKQPEKPLEIKPSKESKTTPVKKIEKTSNKPTTNMGSLSGKPIVASSESKPGVLWVDKYKPQTIRQIVGQHGDRSPAKKLSLWLSNWTKNYNLGFKKNGEADHFKGALLSGPPGIGKTTTAHVVAKDLGYKVIEYNASITRSKSQMTGITSLTRDCKSDCWSKDLKYCLVMDEIDGMSGNEDRGGLVELINIIKNSKIPIICICNDRQSRKLQTIANYLYDLRFRKLTLEQMTATVKSVMFKEKISLPEGALNEIVMSSNFDLRQVFNNIQVWSATEMDCQDLKSEAQKSHKEFKIGPFDVVQKVFTHEKVKTLTQKSDLFFEDYDLGGLFVQENYLRVAPFGCRNDMEKTMQLISNAADSIAMSDIVATKIRTTNNWGLLPLQGMYASVIPGEYMHGNLTDRISFPSWLGKFSKQNKNKRILSNLCLHMRNSTHGGISNPASLSMDYSGILLNKILKPLKEGDIETTLNILNQLNLLREDIDLLIEATSWSHLGDPMSSVSSQIKGALTRAYNKSNFKVPYSIVAFKKSRATTDESALLDLEAGEEMEETEENDDNGIDRDCNILKKVKKSKDIKPKKTTTTSSKPKKESVKKTRTKK